MVLSSTLAKHDTIDCFVLRSKHDLAARVRAMKYGHWGMKAQQGAGALWLTTL